MSTSKAGSFPYCPYSQEPSFVGNTGNVGNSQRRRGLWTFPHIKELGNKGNTHLFLNKREPYYPTAWLFLFPTKMTGEQVPALDSPDYVAVPTVPPFPTFLKPVAHGHSNTAVWGEP